MFEMKLSAATRDQLEYQIGDIIDNAHDYGYGGELSFSKYTAIREILDLIESTLIAARENGDI